MTNRTWSRILVGIATLLILLAIIAKFTGDDPAGLFDWWFLLAIAANLSLMALALCSKCGRIYFRGEAEVSNAGHPEAGSDSEDPDMGKDIVFHGIISEDPEMGKD